MRNPFMSDKPFDVQQDGTSQSSTYQDNPQALEPNESYRVARQIEINIAAKAHQNEQSWRRIAFVEAVLLALAMIAIVVLGAKNQHDVLVYREDAHGLHVMSEAISTRTPSREEVEAQIVRWLRGLRDVPGGADYAAVDRDIHDVLASTQSNSKALEDIRRFYTEQNPKVLSASLSRTVRDVRVNSYTANTYSLDWSEDVRMGNRTYSRTYSGRVTIVDPRIPDDPEIGLLNPAGVYVADFDLPWSNP